MRIKLDLFRVFSSNVINVLAGIINGFLLPAYLSIDAYASIKTFTLYLGYVGILHFGFNDGIYLKYGGKTIEEIQIEKFKGEHHFLISFQFVITLCAIGLGVLLNDFIFIAFSLAILPMNIQTLYQFLYQAIGEFKSYTKIVILTPNLLLIFNIILIFIVKVNNYWLFIIVNILCYYVVFIGLEINFYKRYRDTRPSIDFREIKSLFKVGIFIMVGNFASILIYSVDRWFVKWNFTSSEFAYYAFAVQMMTVISTLITTITMTFYPYLAKGETKMENLQLLKRYFLMVGVMVSGSYFIFSAVVHLFLEKYIPSLDVIAILFSAIPAMIIINALFVNLYKVEKRGKKYVNSVLIICVVSIVLNFTAVSVHASNISIALSTVITFYIWYLYSIKDYKIFKPDRRELFYLIVYLIMYFITTTFFDWLVGIIMFYFISFIMTLIFYKNELVHLIKGMKNKNETSIGE